MTKAFRIFAAFKMLRNGFMRFIKEDSAIEQNIHVIWISRNLERVTDLSTNIAEDVLYMVDGKIIKHHYNE